MRRLNQCDCQLTMKEYLLRRQLHFALEMGDSMKRLFASLVVSSLFCTMAAEALAQRPSVFTRPQGRRNPAANIVRDATINRPTTSPYLNLLRPQGATGVPNYQSLVRPQLQQDRTNAQQRRTMNNLQNQISNLQVEGAPPPYTGVRPTGHRSSFMQTGNYFGSYP